MFLVEFDITCKQTLSWLLNIEFNPKTVIQLLCICGQHVNIPIFNLTSDISIQFIIYTYHSCFIVFLALSCYMYMYVIIKETKLFSTDIKIFTILTIIQGICVSQSHLCHDLIYNASETTLDFDMHSLIFFFHFRNLDTLAIKQMPYQFILHNWPIFTGRQEPRDSMI